MKQPPILMYHWFRAADEPSQSQSPQLEITPELFQRQMEHLARKGYRGVTLAEMLEAPGEGRDRRIALTFDDGTLDFWEHARPTLQAVGFKATLFIVTGYVGGKSTWDEALAEPGRPLLDWEQIGALHAEGHEIGSHTHGHRVLTDLSDEDARGELAESRQAIADHLGAPPRHFAYPRGFFAPRHREMVAATGYAAACAVILDWGDMRRAHPYALRRMTIKGTESMTRFRLRVALSHHVPLQA